MKDKTGSWKLDYIKTHNTSVLVGSIVGSILCTIFICIVIAYIQRRHYKRQLSNFDKINFASETNLTSCIKASSDIFHATEAEGKYPHLRFVESANGIGLL